MPPARFRANAIPLVGEDHYRDIGHRTGSTDMGDLSQVMPILHPYMGGAEGTGHAADYRIVDRISQKVIDTVRTAREIRATTPAGTDLRAELNPAYRWIKTSGLITREKWGNLPGGEVFTTPGRVNGTFAKHSFEGSSDNLRILGAMGDVVFAPRMSGKAGVYVLGGIGFQNGKVTDGPSETKFAWNAGAGLRVNAGSLGLYVEGRFLSINTDGGKTNTIPITAGVKLGGN